MVLLKTLFTIYPKNDKQNIVIKVCKIAPTPLTPFFGPPHQRQNFMDPRYPRYPRQNLIHATHASMHPRHPRDLADSS